MSVGPPLQAPPDKKNHIDKFLDDLFEHAQELHTILRANDDEDKIKDRITCLKYLEEVTKSYFQLKGAINSDPSAAGSTVRKYATAFAQNGAGGGAPRKRGRKPATFPPAPALPGGDDLEDDGDTAD